MVFYGNVIDLTDGELLLQQYRKQMKKQERIAIQACLNHKRLLINDLRAEISEKFIVAIQDLHQYHSETMVKRLEGCFEGATADMAKKYLENIPKRVLQNPIK